MPYVPDYELLRIIAPPIGTAVSALIIGGLGMATAHQITRKIEQMKLDSQENLERERMAFQRESELQKQRLELYKTLYTARLEASDKLSDASSRLTTRMLDGLEAYADQCHEHGTYYTQEIQPILQEVANLSYRYRWLFTNEVNNQANKFVDIAQHFPLLQQLEQIALVGQVTTAMHMLFLSISDMMKRHDISKLMDGSEVPEG